MPGIAGVISQLPALECSRLLDAMLGSMQHESYYVTKTCQATELGIYAGWVAHPNSFPTIHSGTDEASGIMLVFSGECFPGGTTAPTAQKWVVQQYLALEEKFIESLNGLFSGLLIDRRKQKAWLFNDRYGIERLYFHEAADVIYFASEAKALLSVMPQLRAFDEKGVAQFLAYGCTFDQQTLFQGITLAPGGTCWTIEPGRAPRKTCYFTPAAWEAQTPLSLDQFAEEFTALFLRILPQYVGSGENIGVSLTGGLDSRMVMAALPVSTGKPVCYTYSGQDHDVLDTRLAARIAATCGLKHHTLRVGDEFLANFSNHVDRTAYISDGCAGALGAHEIYLNAAGRQLAPIRLTGNYGSEVMRAVSTFKPHRLTPALLNPDWQSRVNHATANAPDHQIHPVTFSTFREIPWSLFGNLATGRSQVTFRSPFLDNELVALAYRTPLIQRTSPVPALRLIQRGNPALAAIPTDRGIIGESRGPAFQARRLFAEVTFKLDYMHKEGLPSALSPFAPLLNALDHTGLLGLHKFLAYRLWFQKQLAPHLTAVLTDPRTRSSPFWDAPFLERMLSDHLKGRQNYVREIGQVLTLDAIKRTLIDV